jgi:large subunit ribosomal protein L3
MAVEGLLGKKLGMVQVFEKNGTVVGCTVVEAGPCLVTQVKTKDRDGYEAVQLGYGTKKRLNEPEKGHLKGLGNFRHLHEFRADTLDGVEVGQRIGAELFQPGDLVDVTGVSKGRGFAGVVKRHGFHGGPKTHGQSDRHRAPGSIGSGTTPGRVHKGLKMAGHMGDRRTTVRNLQVVESNPARGILILKGPVPGATDGLLRIRKAQSAGTKTK